MDRIHGKVRLVIESGETVCEGQLPSFDKWPDILVWGSRLFVFDKTRTMSDTQRTVYREGFAFALLQYDATLPINGATEAEVQKLREQWRGRFGTKPMPMEGGKLSHEELTAMAKELGYAPPMDTSHDNPPPQNPQAEDE